jgi:hypothetical protein
VVHRCSKLLRNNLPWLHWDERSVMASHSPLNDRDEKRFGSGNSQVATNLSSMSDALHRSLVRQPVCCLVIDAAAGELVTDSALLQALQDHILVPVPSRHPDLDASMMPRLVAIDSSTSSGSEALQGTLRVALDELDPQRLRAGYGRQISAWLCCEIHDDLSDQCLPLQAHLSRSLLQTRDSRTVLLRWYDPAVLWGLWPLLDDDQRVALFGPIQSASILSPIGGWLRLQRPAGSVESKPPTTDLSLSSDQWLDIDHLTALNGALRLIDLPAGPDAANCLTAMRAQVMHALRRARGYSIGDAQDLILFARLALQVHPLFDRHALIQARLAQRVGNVYFSAVIDDLTPEQWQGIKTECTTKWRPDHMDIV